MSLKSNKNEILLTLILFLSCRCYSMSLLSTNVNDVNEGSCRDYTFDSCRINVDSIIETVKNITENQCQEFCITVFGKDCSIFVYNRIQVKRLKLKKYLLLSMFPMYRTGGVFFIFYVCRS